MVFRRMHFPWVVSLIVGGIILGPHVLNMLQVTPAAEFIGQVGLVFLMFMAGIETKVSNFRGFQRELWFLSFVNGAVPFMVGYAIAWWFGYGGISAVLVGIIFVSSSIAVVIPSLERNGLMSTRIGQSVIITTVLQDIASLILLSFVLQSAMPVTPLPLWLFYPLVFIVLGVMRFVIPAVVNFLRKLNAGVPDIFQQEFRTVFFLLMGAVVVFELLGLHPITAAFFVGLVLADSLKNSLLKDKIRTISYGVFIPAFFIIVGAQTDIGVLTQSRDVALLTTAIVVGSVVSKLISGWVGARVVGFTNDQSLLFAISSVPQLSTTLAVAFTALSLGFIDQKLLTAMIVLSIVTVVVSPTLMNLIGHRIKNTLLTKTTS